MQLYASIAPSNLGVPKFTALIHTSSVHGLALTLRSARVASETLVIHPSDGAVERLCMRYGARDTIHVPGVTPGAYAMDAFHDWLLLLLPGEELSDDLFIALAKWRRQRRDERVGYLIRSGEDFSPQFRLVNRAKVQWVGDQPPIPAHAEVFPGLIALGSSLRAA
jgi:hypothetical protein